MEITKRTARVLIRREVASDKTPWYVAQVLEHDLATQAKSLNELGPKIEHMIVAHIECSENEKLVPFDSLPAAPKKYFDEYEASEKEQAWTVVITRGKLAEARVPQMPELVYRFAPGA